LHCSFLFRFANCWTTFKIREFSQHEFLFAKDKEMRPKTNSSRTNYCFCNIILSCILSTKNIRPFIFEWYSKHFPKLLQFCFSLCDTINQISIVECSLAWAVNISQVNLVFLKLLSLLVRMLEYLCSINMACNKGLTKH
jgi:hypothetical protein